jgi:hypothetical protein
VASKGLSRAVGASRGATGLPGGSWAQRRALESTPGHFDVSSATPKLFTWPATTVICCE